MIEWHIEKRKISELKDYEKNPRRISKEQAEHLKASLEKFGLIDKPIINTDNTIIGGHQRKNTLKKMGIHEVECNVPSRTLSEREIEELNVRLNRNQGEFDYDILANSFEVPDLVDYGFSLDTLLGHNEKDDCTEKTDSVKKGKKLKMCPQCGHEF